MGLVLTFPALASALDIADLPPEQPILRRLAPGETHEYQAALQAGHSWRVSVEQRGIDVTLALHDPAGRRLIVDGPFGRRGMEFLLVTATSTGAHRFEIRPRAAALTPGEYRIERTPAGNTTARERLRLAAEAAMTRAAAEHAAGRSAITEYQAALDHWRTLEDRDGEAHALQALAVLHRRAGEWRTALNFFRQVLPLWRALGNRNMEAGALNGLGTIITWSLHENSQGRKLLEQALALQQTLGHPYGEAVARHNLCLIHHSEGALRTALTCYEQMLAHLSKVGDLRFEAMAHNNLGGVYSDLGEPEPARHHFEQALTRYQTLDDLTEEARTLNNLGALDRTLGAWEKALDHYGQALERLEEIGEQRLEATLLNNTGSAYFGLGDLQTALDYYQVALGRRQALGDRGGEATTTSNIGRVYLRLGENDRALESFHRGLTLRRQTGDRRKEARAGIFVAKALLAQSEPTSALEYLDQALALLRNSGDRYYEARARNARAQALNLLGRPREAMGELERALTLWRGLERPVGRVEAFGELAVAHRRLGQLEDARRHSEEALGIVEALRTRIHNPNLRATLLNSERRVVELGIELLMELHRRNPTRGYDRAALEASERARARTLLDLLRESGADLHAGIEPTLATRRASLRRQLDLIDSRRQARARRGDTGETAAQLDLALRQTLTELDNLESHIRRDDSRFAALTRPQPASARQIQDLLDSETSLLQYSLGEERSYLWLVTRDSVESFELPGRAQIDAAARKAHHRLSTLELRGRKAEEQELAALSRLVLGPVAARLESRRLVVVADGALHYLPFAALPFPSGPSGGTVTASPEPLLVRHEIVSLPSTSVLAEQRRQPARARVTKEAVILADPVFQRRDPRLAQHATENITTHIKEHTTFDRLPATRLEAEQIASVFPVEEVLLALDFRARRASVLDGTLAPYRIVHFATHGVIDTQNPRLSALVLSLYDEAGRRQEGLVRLPDIFELELGAELVVLSGCQTALGREIRGEGLVGLTRGFMYAGAPRVMASLWRVEDRATAELMTRLYHGMLREGLHPGAALRQAQLAIFRERAWRDPYYWAAFILQGDWR